MAALPQKRDALPALECAAICGDALLATAPTVATAYGLVQRFGHMVRERQATDLETWLADAHASGIAEVRSFVQGVQRDCAAVEAGFTVAWSEVRLKAT